VEQFFYGQNDMTRHDIWILERAVWRTHNFWGSRLHNVLGGGGSWCTILLSGLYSILALLLSFSIFPFIDCRKMVIMNWDGGLWEAWSRNRIRIRIWTDKIPIQSAFSTLPL